jgi:molybdopterin converting factor small subunit
MGRKSTIVRAAAPVKAAIDRALKDDRLTLDEILEYLREQYPEEKLPSRSAIGRYKQNFDELAKELKEAREIAGVWAQKLGEDPEHDIGKVTIEMLSTLSYRVSQSMMRSGEDIDAKSVSALARAQQYIEDAGRMSLDREIKVRRAALEAAAKRAEKAAKKSGASATSIDAMRQAIMQEIAA